MPGSWKVSDGSSPRLLELLLPLLLLGASSKGWDCVGSAAGDVSGCAPKPGPSAGVGVRLAGLAGAGLLCWGELGAAAGELEPCKTWRQSTKQTRSRNRLSLLCLFQIPPGASIYW